MEMVFYEKAVKTLIVT